MAGYATIVADPPWRIEANLGKGGRRKNKTSVPYSFMSIEEIAALEVEALAADDAVLFLWSTRRVFREGDAVRVARAWGFEPCGEIIWGLRTPGMGTRSFANDHEPCLIASRGKPLIEADDPVGVYFWRQFYEYGPSGVPQKKHSAKPTGFMEFVEQLAPEPRLELFAREQRLGWSTWGNEAFGHVELSAA